jgi:hypothetical protein
LKNTSNRNVRDQIDIFSLQLSDGFKSLDEKLQALVLDLHRDREIINLSAAQERKFIENLLKSLDFPTRRNRYDEVSAAHQNTFQWIYQPSSSNTAWSSFPEWLENNGRIYWVQGKAASGKSTLMRYICQNEGTRRLLLGWTGSLPLLVATCFFWNSGSVEQKSQAGCLRSLLYEMFAQQSNLVSIALPELWACRHKYCQSIDQDQLEKERYWTLPRLLKTFKFLVTQDTLPIRVCFFIDSLDEFAGDHEELAMLFSNITMSPNIKACVSSRPLLTFEDALGHYSGLRLQDLTHLDIKQYVGDKLANSPKFRKLLKEEPTIAPKLIEEIVTKADGVFLWVKLVVESLLAGIGNRDNIFELQRRLRSLPSDLEALYCHMMTGIDSFYQPAAAKMFQLAQTALAIGESSSKFCRKARGPLTTLEFICAIEEVTHLPLSVEIANWEGEVIRMKKKRAEARVKVYSAGLLEVHGDQLQYMHRTVKDYLIQPKEMAAIMTHPITADFNPHFALLQASVMLLKVAPVYIDVWLAALTSFECASRLEIDMEPAYITFINEMDTCFSLKINKNWCLPYLEWLFDDQNSLQGSAEKSFLAAIVHYGLNAYLETKWMNDSNLGSSTLPALSGSTKFKFCVSATTKTVPLLKRMRIFSQPSAQGNFSKATLNTATLLLQSGEDPNESYGDTTTWQDLLLSQKKLLDHTTRARERARSCMEWWTKHVKVFLQFGADLRAQNQGCSLRTALGALEACGFKAQTAELCKLAHKRAEDDLTLEFPFLSELQRDHGAYIKCGKRPFGLWEDCEYGTALDNSRKRYKG